MKVSTSASLSFLCFLLVVTETSAWSMGSIFGNLMFAVSGCMNQEYTTGCMPIKGGPARNHQFWENVCPTSSSRRRLSADYQWTVVACSKQHGGNYIACSNNAVEYCSEEYAEESAESSASEYDASGTGENSISAGTTSSRRMSFLPYIIAATVSTMFIGLFVWKKRRDQQHAQEADELLADDSFHGSIAKRISNKLSRKKTVSETEFVKTTGYALA